MSRTEMTMYGINERRPGARWQALFEATWPAYRAWYSSEGTEARPELATAAGQLERHMPELVPTWLRLVELTGHDTLAATMLTLWDPPKFLPGCSQAVVPSPEPALVRNYDYSPALFERTVYSSQFGSRRVIGTGDCLWGLLDGMNSDGFVVSLAYGGRPGSAPGFAAPLIVRYLLEVCGSTAEAKARLVGLPVSMSYNLTMVDASGAATTAFVAPGEEPAFFTAVATNHRGEAPERVDHARRFRSVERRQILADAVRSGSTVEETTALLLRPPLHSRDYDHAFGTLYTAVYRPLDGEVDYVWPHAEVWRRSFDSEEEIRTVTLGSDIDPSATAGGSWTAGTAGAPEKRVTTSPRPAGAGSVAGWEAYAEMSVSELGSITRDVIGALSRRPDQEAFAELLSLYEVLGVAMGESARTMAQHGSWSSVADVAGISRQAAWYRWRG